MFQQLWKIQTTNVLIFTASCFGVFGFTWFEAQDKCHRDGEKIATRPASRPSTPFWTSYHKRTSHWIGNLGCYSDQDLYLKGMAKYSMTVPSAGLCQEKCTTRTPSIFLFAIQKKSCFCLKEPPKKPASLVSNCKFCMESSKFSTDPDCDDKVPYRIFLSIIQEDIKFPESNCDKRNECCETHLNRINDKEILETKANDFTLVFRKIGDLLKGPLEDWYTCIVFTRQIYTSLDQGDKLTDFDKSKISSCQRCEDGCPFVDCNVSVDTVFCSKTILTARPAIRTTPERKTKVTSNIYYKQNWKPTSITVFINQPKTTKINSETAVPPHTSFNISSEGKLTVITDQSSYAATTMYQQKTKEINGKVTGHWNDYTTTVDLTTDKKGHIKYEDRSHEDLIQIVTPVLAIVISACLMCVVINLIRWKQNTRGKRSLESQKDFSSGCIVDKNFSSTLYAAIKNKTDEQCLEECTYDLADNSNLEEERFTWNTEEESNYDHLRDKAQNKNVEEDIYNHLQIETESNYSTFTRGLALKGIVDNTYGEADFQNDAQNCF